MELEQLARELKDAKKAYGDCRIARQQLIDNLRKIADILENQEQHQCRTIYSVSEHRVQISSGDAYFPEREDIYNAFRNCQVFRERWEQAANRFREQGIDAQSFQSPGDVT